MRYKLRLVILITVIIFLFYSNINSFAGVVLIEGDTNTLGILAYTKYLDKKPVLLFTEQERNLKMKDLIKINSFVFKDSSWQDLAIQLASLSVNLLAGKKSKIKIEKLGVYEIYVETSEIKGETPVFDIEINGKEIALRSLPLAYGKERKFLKVGGVELGEGKHTITAHSSQLIAHRDKAHSSQLIANGKKQDLKLILVNKKEREMAEKLIRKKIDNPETEIAYIFSKKESKFYVP